MFALHIPSGLAKDWPQLGGAASRNMYSPETNLPVRIDPGKFKPNSEEVDLGSAKNLKWAAKLGSQSYGNVTVAGGKVFIGTNNDFPRDPQHKGDRSILMCFDEKTGKFLWQLVIPKLAAGKVHDWDQIGLLSSPTIDGNRVYIVTTRCEVMCLDVNGLTDGNQGPITDEATYMLQEVKASERPPAPLRLGPQDADIIWVYDMMHELGVFPHNAAGSAVLVVEDTVYACTSNGQDWNHNNVPSPFSPSLIALDKQTGKLVAVDDAGIGPRLFHGQWSSPALGEGNGRKLIIFGGGDGWCYAFDAKPARAPVAPGALPAPDNTESAVLKTAWKFDCNPPEYKMKDGHPLKHGTPEGPSEIIATPAFYQNRVYAVLGQDPEAQDGVGRLVCIDATKTGDITKSGLVWDFKDIHHSMSTVSIDPQTGLLFIADFAGFVYCLNAANGQINWCHDMKAHIWGSTLVADGKVYVGDEDGNFVVFAARKEKSILSSSVVDGRSQEGPNFGAPLYGTPVAANGVLYIYTHTHLYTFGEPHNSR